MIIEMNNPVKEYPLQPWVKITNGMRPEYVTWAAILSRCRNPNSYKYKDYGGRGIKVCSRWENGDGIRTGFQCFLSDIGQKPSPKHSVDRINNDGDYEPSNCKWSTNKRQANNRRSNRKLTYQGESMSMMDLADKYRMSYFVLRNRISRGWPVDKAITMPLGTGYLPKRTATGAGLPQTVLTDGEVREIRSSYAAGGITMVQVADRFGISPANVCLIVNRKSRKNVI